MKLEGPCYTDSGAGVHYLEPGETCEFCGEKAKITIPPDVELQVLRVVTDKLHESLADIAESLDSLWGLLADRKAVLAEEEIKLLAKATAMAKKHDTDKWYPYERSS